MAAGPTDPAIDSQPPIVKREENKVSQGCMHFDIPSER